MNNFRVFYIHEISKKLYKIVNYNLLVGDIENRITKSYL